jgi:SAM-dependent methyltransferase
MARSVASRQQASVVEKLKELLDNPHLFNLVQIAVSGRQRHTRQLIAGGLHLQSGEALLDVCCGTGEFADVAGGAYLGIDLNPRFIAYARRTRGAGAGYPERKFIVADITRAITKYRGPVFPKAMMINSMHHLSDEENSCVLEAVARLVGERFVVVDMDPTPGFPISRFLADMDRGKYLRPLSEQRMLLERYFVVEYAGTYYSGLCGQTLLVCHVA